MSKIAVVGFGWLGIPLAQKLKSKGFDVCGTTTTFSKIESLNLCNLHAKLLNLNSEINEKEFQDFFSKASVCILAIPPKKSLFQTYQSQCLKLISLFPDGCKFIFTSSTSIYSDQVEIAAENSNILSDFNYTSQLFLTEKALQKNLGNRITILRLAGLYGENRNPAQFLSGKAGLKNPNSKVNLVHLEDVISFIEKILDKNVWGEIFNVCSSEHPTRKDYYTWKCQNDNLLPPVFENTEMENKSKIVTNQKGKDLLGFTYKFDSPFDF